MEKMEDVSEREAMLFAERDIQAVVGGRSLQLEIEGTAEALAQGEAPSFVDARAERSMDHELHAAAFVEEALGDDGRLRGNCSQQRAAGHDVFHGLLGARIVEAAFDFEPVCCGKNACGGFFVGSRRGSREKRADLLCESRDVRGELIRARWRFATPER